jgi:hypothetical protein
LCSIAAHAEREDGIMVATRNLEQYGELHRTKRYGISGARRKHFVQPWIAALKPTSILDYGAGQSTLVNLLSIHTLKVRDRYDPAIPEIATIPRSSYDVVLCTDVLEHLDEAEIEPVLRHVRQHSPLAVFTIGMGTAKAVLPSGENAHATVKPALWWLMTLRDVFPDATLVSANRKFATILSFRPSFAQRVSGAAARLAFRAQHLSG